jgi:hypothetical protein
MSGKKATCGKRRKRNMQEETPHSEKVGKPNHVRVKFLIMIVTTISL